MNINELREQVAALKDEVTALSEADVPSDADEARSLEENLEAKMTEFETRKAELDKAEAREARLDAVKNAAITPANREDGDGTRSFNIKTRDKADVYDLSEVRTIGVDPKKVGAELRSRAVTAIEEAPYMTDGQRSCATDLVEHDVKGSPRSAWILTHGSPEYHEVFQRYMEHPIAGMVAVRELEQRAAMSLTGANGGFLVPFTLDPSIILTNNGATNPFRSIAKQVSITTDDWNGVTSAGVTAEWIAEATEVADASPTFAQPSITVYKADAYIQGSLEVVADASLSGEIAMLIADAKDRLEATAFAVGSGSGQPHGIVTELQLVTASRVAGSSGAAGAADFVVADVYAVQNALPPRHRPNASWLAEFSTYNRIRQFATGSGPTHAFWADLGANTPSLLLGRPTYESSAMDSTIVSGSSDDILVYGDFKKYQIVDRMGVELVYNPLVLGSNRRPSGEVAWVAFWRVGGRALDANAFRMLRV